MGSRRKATAREGEEARLFKELQSFHVPTLIFGIWDRFLSSFSEFHHHPGVVPNVLAERLELSG